MAAEPRTRRYIVAKVIAEARGKHPDIEIETEDGKVWAFLPPQLWTDRAIDPKVGPEDTAREVMGSDTFDGYRASGGTIAVFNLVLTAYGEDQGISMGESSAS